jgi:hypothetical protein
MAATIDTSVLNAGEQELIQGLSDSSPLRYLAVIGGVDWLPAMFGEVICPPEVVEECSHPSAPAALRAWVISPPSWLRVVSVTPSVSTWPVLLPFQKSNSRKFVGRKTEPLHQVGCRCRIAMRLTGLSQPSGPR